MSMLHPRSAQSASPLPDSTHWSFFPDSSTFPILLANPEEPRMGIQQEIGTTVMKVGIGNSLPVIEYGLEDAALQLDALFFAYGLANEYQGALLKIDAVDGYFGLGVSYSGVSPFGLRFRVLHLSAHFVDGHYNPTDGTWRNGDTPIPFSRNFGELVGACRTGFEPLGLRGYLGFSYAAVVKPTDIRPWAGLAGCEVWTPGSPHFYLAYHFSLTGVPVYQGSNTVEGGAKLGDWSGRGVRFFLMYSNGLNTFGQYYNTRKEFWGVGFCFDYAVSKY
jgi:hypothetical protein